MTRHAGRGQELTRALLTRALPPLFEAWTVTLNPGEPLAFTPEPWRDALVVVLSGVLEVEGAAGTRVTFAQDAVLTLSGTPVRTVASSGEAPAVLRLVRRRRVPQNCRATARPRTTTRSNAPIGRNDS